MNVQAEKKVGRSFSLKDSELTHIEAQASSHGFSDKNEYLLALVEADESLALAPQLSSSKRKILRLTEHSPGVADALTQLIAAILPARAERARRLWDEHLAATEIPAAITQGEFLAGLLDAVLEAAQAGRLNLARSQALAIIGGRDWLALVEAIRIGDIPTATQIIASLDLAHPQPPTARSIAAEERSKRAARR